MIYSKNSLYTKTHIFYTCSECGDRSYEDEVETIDVHENAMGEDMVTYKCTICGEVAKSKRFMQRGGR